MVKLSSVICISAEGQSAIAVFFHLTIYDYLGVCFHKVQLNSSTKAVTAFCVSSLTHNSLIPLDCFSLRFDLMTYNMPFSMQIVL